MHDSIESVFHDIQNQQRRCFTNLENLKNLKSKSRKFHKKTRVGVSFLRDSNTGAFCEIFKNTSFEEHLRTTTSKC